MFLYNIGRIINHNFLITLIVVIACLASIQAHAATKGKAAPINSSAQNLLDKVQVKNKVPVIIKLNMAAQAEGKLSAIATAEQRQKIHSSQTALLKKLSKFKPDKIRQFRYLPFISLELDAAGLTAVMSDPGIAAIYEDQLSRPTLADSTSIIGSTAIAASGFRGQGQTIAILDTGVDKTHSFLSGKVVHEACFSQTNSSQGSTSVCPNQTNSQIGAGAGIPCANSIQGCSHGTHVAGIAAGKGSSFSGVAKDAGIMAIQVFSRFTGQSFCGSSGACALSYTSDQISALEHVYSQRNNFKIASVNMSMGGGQFGSFCDGDPRKAAIDLLRSVGIATVISSGNEGFTNALAAPACISSAISVGSTTKTDSVSSFSNSASFLDLLAPGQPINSSVPGNGFAFFSGTSMSAPHVAGAFAVLRSVNNSASVDQIETALKNTGSNILDSRNNTQKPRININQAKNFLTPPNIPTLFVSPSDTFNVTGPKGGPFNPDSRSFTLRNITSSSSSLSYSISKNVNWLQINSGASGTIPANGSRIVTVSITPGVANSLQINDYTGLITFTNTTNAAGNIQVATTLRVTGNNDFFDNAIEISQTGGHIGSTAGNNTNATTETGEPNHAKKDGDKSVWWKWTAPTNGEMTVDSCGSSFDTVMGIYTGTIVSALSEMVSNDDACGLQSSATWSARAGITYYIAIDGFNGASGNITLNWNFTSDATRTPDISVLPATDVTFTGASTGPFNPGSVNYSITNVGSGNQPVAIQTPPWLSASRSNLTLAPGITGNVSFSINSQPAAMPPGIYSGVIDFGFTARAVILNLTSGTLTNDNFTQAKTLSPDPQSTVWNTNLASRETGEPEHANNPGGKSVWWKWTPILSTDVTIDTEGSTFDTLLAIYTGNQLSQLKEFASNDDSGSALSSSLTIPVTAGVTYYIAVDGYNGDSGSLRLNLNYTRKLVKNDMNGDGKSDILWRNNKTGWNWLYQMNGSTISGNFAINQVPGTAWVITGTGDFNGDGKTDILWRHLVSGENWIYLMNGHQISVSRRLNQVGLNWQISGIGDFNGDGKDDILWRHIVTGENWLYLLNGTQIISSKRINLVSDLNWAVAGVGDFNGDGKDDILWHHTNGTNWLYLMNSHQIRDSRRINQLTDANWKIADVGDFNADGKADILWRHEKTGINWLYLMNGYQVSSSNSINKVQNLNWKIANVGDFNGDGMADILWRHATSGENWLYLMNGIQIVASRRINIVNPDWKIVPDN